MNEQFNYDIFLSHNSKDKPRVRNLAERLREGGLRVWLDEWVIRPGDDIYLAIERGVEASRTLVLCMSRATFDSDWVTLERSTVIFRDPANRDRRFIPLLLADCEIPDAIRRYRYIDYRDEGEAAFRELMEACGTEAEAPTPSLKTVPDEKPEEGEAIALFERKLEGHTAWARSVAVSPDGKWAVSGSSDSTVKIWDLETGECRATLEGHEDEVNCVAVTPDGKRVLSASDDKTIRVWGAQTGRQLAICEGHTSHVLSVTAASNSQHALSGSTDRTLKLWDINSGRRLKTIQGHNDGVFSVAVNPDGTHAISGAYNGELKYWRLETEECLATLPGHASIVKSVEITPDGRYAVSGADDQTLKLWDLETAACVWELEGHRDDIHSVSISPDGALIASTGFLDWTVRLWDLKSGALLQVIDTGDNARTDKDIFSI